MNLTHSPDDILPLLHMTGDVPTLELGIDCARYGADFSVLFALHFSPRLHALIEQTLPNHRPPYAIIHATRWNGTDTYVSANIVSSYVAAAEAAGWIVTAIRIDVIGISGVADALMHQSPRFSQIVHPINVSMSPTDTTRFLNTRAELAWDLRALFRARLLTTLTRTKHKEFGLPDKDPSDILLRFREQATTLAYKTHEQNGKLQVESKPDYKKRTERSSPDEFDAAALAVNILNKGEERRPASVMYDTSFPQTVMAR